MNQNSAADLVARAAQLPAVIGQALGGFGGFLRCESCGAVEDMTDDRAGRYTADGWPRCCGYTMRWWTQRQVDAGEVPEFGSGVSV
jgi:hypothetical protein